MSELAATQKKLADFQEGEETRWQEKKAAFLTSSEYYELLGPKPSNMLKYGFEGVDRRFLQSRLIPKGTDLSFLNP